MKMPGNQTNDNGLYDYGENSYFNEGIDNNGVEEFNSPAEDDFSEYLWMENEEEFDKEELQRLEEEALMEQCIEAMLDDENSERSQNNSESTNDVTNLINNLKLDVDVKSSNLNPLAAEFVPGGNNTSGNTVERVANGSS
ncbi:unnamed protein product [Brassicogethes aeneus]|uniref:Ataxin-2 C-terminal domain-containing protein n=1 Tax=Brassicogethes aeneus TaxID=1431903 RepID=A0A9P0BDF4_BRAAE|nr:unnamed protein product [Brassicogethes aeneus]